MIFMEPLADGVYEAVRTHRLDRALEAARGRFTPEFNAVDDADAPDVIARHVAEAVRRVIADEPDGGRRVELANRVLSQLAAEDERLTDALQQLIALSEVTGTGARKHIRPVTPLSQAALLTNAREEPSLSAELRAELASADRVDLLCAFIRWPGLRLLEDVLLDLRDRGVPFRVLTTTYVGATERPAIDRLVRRFGADVRVSYETQSTRLHAKAWLFRRNSGYDTAFVGSSNLSRSALVEGLEWNVRLSGVATPELLRKFEATFDTYWASSAFVPYDPETDADRFDDALRQAGRRTSAPATISLAGLEVRPLPHQQEILEALESERQVHDRHRNLVVAATGTGKTVIAALDYRHLRADGDLTLLFVAHRKEILQQALRVYRETLIDETFGEAYVGGARPERWRHVFASIQGLHAHGIEKLPPEHFDVVVVDEFHHAEAATYQRLLNHLRPKELLGLTATPERGTGGDVREMFGGRTAFELPLWEALSADLLIPFHYFGVADGTDLAGVEWKRGRYDVTGLEHLYTGNDARAAKVLKELRDKVTDVGTMRALGFCVSIAHAEYMARVFRQAGINALAVSGNSSPGDRERAITALRAREVNALFAVDLFNEGLDIPEVDTVLFLRPTDSATVFLQQLGRGLRRAPGKAVLTVLDFIGQHRKEFRFDTRYRALTGASRRGLQRQIEQGFPFLPAGSQVVLDRVAQQIVLDNVRTQLRFTRAQLAADVRSHGDLALTGYLEAADRELVDVYRGGGSWTGLRRDAGLPVPPAGPDEGGLLRRMAAFTHVDDPERAEVYRRLVAVDGPAYEELTERHQRLARMLLFTLWPKRRDFPSYRAGLEHLRRHPAVCAEIDELLTLGLDRARHVPASLGEGLQHVPLTSHSRYRREEILAALGHATLQRVPGNHVSGVAWCEDTRTDALLINLRKSEKDFSPTTMYRDYAISPELFHWESQNATSLDSPTGRRYLQHRAQGSHVVLFVRETKTDDLGAAPFVCLGPASYVEHRGERPIAITWRLHRPMPADAFSVASVAG
ncbi:type III restriction protein res subunit [Amycolatopsis methanolica 239]|uniref:Type III restriction protein res subunit n=2 Tax=Amycolatopsis methanolica TaxID=1814 RepID=A0A076MTJ4_AMYME|nr:type III restriction protein res subunit [Amycolatopsis methanolica 239]